MMYYLKMGFWHDIDLLKDVDFGKTEGKVLGKET